MEENQELRFVCRFCNKKCFSGKSLGGHMRGHLALISAAKKGKEKLNSDEIMKNEDDLGQLDQEMVKNGEEMEVEGSEEDGYGLRENPKKSWKISDVKKRNHCKECGKGFLSVRALSGHMRCHPLKERESFSCKKCEKVFDSMRALFGHMKCHSKRSRINHVDQVMVYEAPESLEISTLCPIKKKRSRIRYKPSLHHSFPSFNGSGSSMYVNETEEVEDVALCLMMLSRGVTNWDFEWEVSIDDFLYRNKFKKLKSEIDFENDSSEVKLWKNLIPSVQINDLEFDPFKNLNSPECDDSTFWVESFAESEPEPEPEPNPEPKSEPEPEPVSRTEYKCKTCGQIFNSHQALGGHQSKHKIVNKVEKRVDYEGSEDDEELNESMKVKDYECPVCFKIFTSGQALGGHKRAHYGREKVANDGGDLLWWDPPSTQDREGLMVLC